MLNNVTMLAFWSLTFGCFSKCFNEAMADWFKPKENPVKVDMPADYKFATVLINAVVMFVNGLIGKSSEDITKLNLLILLIDMLFNFITYRANRMEWMKQAYISNVIHLRQAVAFDSWFHCKFDLRINKKLEKIKKSTYKIKKMLVVFVIILLSIFVLSSIIIMKKFYIYADAVLPVWLVLITFIIKLMNAQYLMDAVINHFNPEHKKLSKKDKKSICCCKFTEQN